LAVDLVLFPPLFSNRRTDRLLFISHSCNFSDPTLLSWKMNVSYSCSISEAFCIGRKINAHFILCDDKLRPSFLLA
jgi:hypothetical protein